MVLFVKYGVPWGQFRASGTSMNSLSFSPTPLHITTCKPVRLSQNFPTGSGGVRKSTDPLMPESPPNTERGSSFSWCHYLCIWTTYGRRRAILLNSPAISSPFETSTHGGGISITVARPSIFNTIRGRLGDDDLLRHPWISRSAFFALSSRSSSVLPLVLFFPFLTHPRVRTTRTSQRLSYCILIIFHSL